MTREEIMQLNTDYLNGCESEHKMNELFSYVLEQQLNRDKNPCETCGYVEGSPFCLEYCPYDAERMKEQQSCEDAISRQAVLDTISELNAISFYEAQEDSKECYYEIRQAVKALPPVTPKQKYGKWIFVDKAKEHAYCSECNYGNVDLFDGRPHNYCPNCGCRMVEPQESERV